MRKKMFCEIRFQYKKFFGLTFFLAIFFLVKKKNGAKNIFADKKIGEKNIGERQLLAKLLDGEQVFCKKVFW